MDNFFGFSWSYFILTNVYHVPVRFKAAVRIDADDDEVDDG